MRSLISKERTGFPLVPAPWCTPDDGFLGCGSPLTLESVPALVYGEDCPEPSAGRLSLLFGPCYGQQRTCGCGLRLGRCGDTHMFPRSRLRAVVTFMAWQAPCPWL